MAGLGDVDVSSTRDLILYNIWATISGNPIKGTMTAAELDLSSTTNWILYNIYLSLSGGALNPTLQQVLTNGNVTTLQAIFQTGGIETIVDGGGVSVDDGAGTMSHLGQDKLEMQDPAGDESSLSAGGVSFASLPTESAQLDSLGLSITDTTDASLLTKTDLSISDATEGASIDKATVQVAGAIEAAILTKVDLSITDGVKHEIGLDALGGVITAADTLSNTFVTISDGGSIEQVADINGDGVSDNTIINVKAQLTAAEIKLLFSNPKEIIPAETGKAIQIISGVFIYNFNTSEFTNNQLIVATASQPQDPQASSNNVFDSLTSVKGTLGLIGYAEVSNTPNIATNVGMVLTSDSDSVIGDGTLSVDIRFRYIDGF